MRGPTLRSPPARRAAAPRPCSSVARQPHLAELHARLAQQRQRRLAERIGRVVGHLVDPGVDDHLRAHQAGREGRVQGAAAHRDAVEGRLRDRVLLAVRAQALVEARPALREGVAARAAALVAVARPARGAVVAGRDDAPVARDHRGDLALHAVAARRDHARDRHEVLVPARALEAEALLEQLLERRVQRLQAAVVADAQVGDLPHGEELLRRGVRARELLPLEAPQLRERARVAGARPLAHAREPRRLLRLDPEQAETSGAGAQRVDLRGVAHGVDRVVAVRGEAAREALGEGPGALRLAQLAPGRDHPLAGLLDSPRAELVADHVGERERVEGAGLEEADHLALARTVQARYAEDHAPPAI